QALSGAMDEQACWLERLSPARGAGVVAMVANAAADSAPGLYQPESSANRDGSQSGAAALAPQPGADQSPADSSYGRPGCRHRRCHMGVNADMMIFGLLE